MQNCRHRCLSAQAGFTLIETLTALALTTMVTLTAGSVLFATMRSETALQRQTNQFESLRIAAAMIQQDARFAVEASCTTTGYLTLYSDTTNDDYVKYWFRNGNGTADSKHLHRHVYQGGGLVRDDIVGWDLIPAGQPNGTTFGCTTDLEFRTAKVVLSKTPLPGQSQSRTTRLEVTAFLR